MELMITAVVSALKGAGVAATSALPAATMPQLNGPVTAVGLQSATATRSGFYDYLGLETMDDGSRRELYGRKLEATLFLDIYSPARLGGAECRRAAEAVSEVLLCGVDGVSLGTFTLGQCVYDEASNCFLCACTVEANAYVYAVASEDGTEFTDFILKGVLK
jgi:hypothetical protein